MQKFVHPLVKRRGVFLSEETFLRALERGYCQQNPRYWQTNDQKIHVRFFHCKESFPMNTREGPGPAETQWSTFTPTDHRLVEALCLPVFAPRWRHSSGVTLLSENHHLPLKMKAAGHFCPWCSAEDIYLFTNHHSTGGVQTFAHGCITKTSESEKCRATFFN